MKNKIIFAAMTAFALAGCQEAAEITQAPANARLINPAKQTQLAKGTSKLVVRAYLPSETGKGLGSEVIGAKCDLRSDDLQAAVSTPQEVIVPKFKQRAEYEDRGVPSALVVTCESAGRVGRQQVTAVPKSAYIETGAGAAGLLVSVVASAAIAASTPWVYEGLINVVLADEK